MELLLSLSTPHIPHKIKKKIRLEFSLVNRALVKISRIRSRSIDFRSEMINIFAKPPPPKLEFQNKTS